MRCTDAQGPGRSRGGRTPAPRREEDEEGEKDEEDFLPHTFVKSKMIVVGSQDAGAKLGFVDVVLRKLGKGSRAVAGRLVRAPRKGSVVVIEFPDGMHEYVTTPVKRVLRLAGREVFYIETINSRYRLEVRGREDAVAENAG